MNVGASATLLNVGDRPDPQIYWEGVKLAMVAEEFGFDSVWTMEHHFTGHSPVPNPLQYLSYLAARCQRVQLGAAVVSLPWHNPVRVAEEIAVLDILSNGRLLVGFGRGASAVEFGGFQIALEEARPRFLEAVEIITRGLSGDTFSYSGKYYVVPRVQIRPRPQSAFRERLYGAATGAESASIIGGLGLGLMTAPDRNLALTANVVDGYRQASSKGSFAARPPVIHMYISNAETEGEAYALANRYGGALLLELRRHYGYGTLSGHADGDARPEEGTGGSVTPARSERAFESTREQFIESHLVGTPDQCLMQLEKLYDATGFEHLILEFSFGGMPVEKAVDGMRLFATKVLPVLRDERSFRSMRELASGLLK